MACKVKGKIQCVGMQDHVLQRAFTVEPMHALAATADGTFVAGGGASGSIYIWASGSGQLLRSWPAHYKVTKRPLKLCTTLSMHIVKSLAFFNVKYVFEGHCFLLCSRGREGEGRGRLCLHLRALDGTIA